MEASYHRHDVSGEVWALLEPHLQGTAPMRQYLYKLRLLVENCSLVLKRWRGIATCYAKSSDAFITAVHVRCIAI